MNKAVATLRDRLAGLVEALGYEFVGCELIRHSKRRALLRVYIDNTAGITVNDCSKVSRQVSAMLDVEDPIQGEYTLEVSSPGLDRPLFEMAHYQQYLGSRVKIRLSSPMDGKRNFVGLLQQVKETDIYLLIDGEEVVIPFSSINKANVIADIN